MGIRGLHSFINKLPGSSRVVNILDEVSNYRRVNGYDPVIIIDLWTMAHNLKQSTRDVIVGSRLNMIEKKFEEFLTKLKAAGTDLIFVFKKTRVNSPGFIKEMEECHTTAHLLVNTLKAGGNLEYAERHFQYQQQRNRNFEFPFNEAVMLVISQVAQRFGNLRGMDTIQNQAATFNVHLANKYKAMAILGLNTYYVFFKGSWAFWSDADLNIDSMTVRQYNKEQVLSSMRLTTQQAPLFVALAGALRSSEANMRRLENHFQSRNRGQMIQNVVRFVNDQQLTFPISDAALNNVISRIYGNCPAELLEDFKKTMRSMDPVENLKVHHEVDSSIMELIKDDYANYAEEILENSPIYISPIYLDLNNTRPSLHEQVSPFIQKTAGLLLKHQPDRKTRTLLVKPSEFAGFTELKVAPIVPEFDVVPLKILVTGRMSDDEKWQILLWLTGLPLTVADLKSIPDDFLMDVIICLHLVKARSVSLIEAECLIRSIVAVHRRTSFSIYPRVVNAKAFNTGFLYMKIFCILHSCIAAVGLDTFQNKLLFDAVQFQEIYAQFNAGASVPSAADMKAALNHLVSVAKGGSGTRAPFVRVQRPPKDKQPAPICESDSESDIKKVNQSTAQEDNDSVDDISDSLQAIKLDPKSQEKIESLIEQSQFEECLKEIEVAQKLQENDSNLSWMKVECLIKLDRLDEADEIIDKAKNVKSAGMLYVNGLRNYYDLKLKDSVVYFNSALRKNPKLVKAEQQQAVATKMLTLINSGCADLKSGKNKEAKETFTTALPLDLSNKNYSRFVFYNLGVANQKLKLYADAVHGFTEALRIKETHSKTLIKRAQCHFEMSEFEDSIIDCEESLRIKKSEEAQKLLDISKTKLKGVVRSPYDIMGVKSGATSGEVKRAFHKLSLILHPDKHPDGTAIDKKKLSYKFGRMKDAYNEIMKKFGL